MILGMIQVAEIRALIRAKCHHLTTSASVVPSYGVYVGFIFEAAKPKFLDGCSAADWGTLGR